MRLLVLGLGAVAGSALFAAAMMLEVTPASAQGGIVCEYGTTQYKRCCRDSYRRKPDLGASARARDIDACMNGESREEPREKKADQRAREDRGPTLGRLRRIDCSTDGCQDGCAADEVAISAFCAAGAQPAANGDRDVQCVGQSEGQRPAVLVCAKR